MRVLYCTDTYLPQVNGVSIVTERSAEGLRARGWEVEVIAPHYPSTSAAASLGFESGARTARVHTVRSFPAPRYHELRVAVPDLFTADRVVRRFQPDLVHCETEGIVGRVGRWAAERRDVPMVSSYHTNFGQYTHAYGFGALAGLVERYIGRFHRAAWRTYTPSEASRLELLRLGVEDVEVWGRGVDLTTFSPHRHSRALRDALTLGAAFTFLYVGRLAPEKSVRVVLDAYRLVVERLGVARVRLVVAGTGPDEAALRRAAPDGTQFLGNLDRSRELPALYASADAFVFASTTETLGLVVLEAMASGLPVVAPLAGGVVDHLRDGINGAAVPPHDPDAMAAAMIRLATDPGRKEALAHGALRTAAHLGWDAELDRLDGSYRQVCAAAERVRAMPRLIGLQSK